jgi:isopropylmalate/homocitrate/citramalate synthase
MRVLVCDVGPRDGLQNEPDTLEPARRADLVGRLAVAGVQRAEAVSFVHPQRVATEDLVYLLHGEGIETGIDLAALIDVAGWLESLLGRQLPGQLYRAGLP